MPRFKQGDPVCWISQAGGREAKKFGFVVEVVPPGFLPKPWSCGVKPRHIESYVVRTTRIARSSGLKFESRLYWPYTSKLMSWWVPCDDSMNIVEARAVIIRLMNAISNAGNDVRHHNPNTPLSLEIHPAESTK